MMTRNLFLRLVAGAIACLAIASIAQADTRAALQPASVSAGVPRAFVSISGADSNPCSAIQPCRSFNQALGVVQPGGEIVVQNSGGYSTGFTITKSVTIDAAGYNASVISLDNTDLCTINAGAGDRVVLRGISFHGASVGLSAINATQVGSLYIEHCSIAEFTDDGVEMLNGGRLFVTGTEVRACANSGIDVETDGATPAFLVGHDSRFTECGNGVFLGLGSSGTARALGFLSDCTASLCTGSGFVAANASNPFDVIMTLTSCRAYGNKIGVEALASAMGALALVRVVNCVSVENFLDLARNGDQAAAQVYATSPGTNLSTPARDPVTFSVILY
jgi:hypothetical protein